MKSEVKLRIRHSKKKRNKIANGKHEQTEIANLMNKENEARNGNTRIANCKQEEK